MADPTGTIKKVRVEASASYDVLIGNGLIKDAGALISGLGGASAAVIVSDDNVFPKYGGMLRESLEAAGLRTICFTAPHGESAKTLAESFIKNFNNFTETAEGKALVPYGPVL